MCGGVALYLVGLGAFRLRMLGQREARAGGGGGGPAGALRAGRLLPAWTIAAGIAALVLVLCAAESLADQPEEEEES